MDDLMLLQKFEPVLRFTKGELFFPSAVDGYLERCSLWIRDKYGQEKQLAAEGELSAEKLANFKEIRSDQVYFLRLVDEPMGVLEYQSWLLRSDKPAFRNMGRMARVGLFSRVIDSFVDASFLIRGVVPGGTTAAAEVRYRDMMDEDPRYVYYARVLREGGYIILHYIFFYFMNDYRSTFDGINDHESDWEQVFVYLSDDENPVPLWVAFSSHDFTGDNLRRRWDDPELHKIETHPISHAGGGSHSNYFLPGDYLLSIEPKFLHVVNDAIISLRAFWYNTLGQGTISGPTEQQKARLVMPYIDYARGDGLSIGPGQDKSWTPIVITESMGWAEDYRGLWGLDTKDRFGGERGPAGPKFNRDGTVRVAWYDPLGWAGLDKVVPPKNASSELESHVIALSEENAKLEGEIEEKRTKLRLIDLEVQSLKRTNLDKIHQAYSKNLETADKELKGLYARKVELTELLAASQSYMQAIQKGDQGDPQAHLTIKRYPEPPLTEMGRLASYWAAISGALLLFFLAALLFLMPSNLIIDGIIVVGVFLGLESIIHHKFTSFLLSVTIVLAIVSSLILIWDFFWGILILGIFAIVVVSLLKNLRKLSGR
ncbi:MAG: hypothetical protein LUQ38_02660 [Methanotrichaceae archaeon]|nr:hypothetical protein [Methanotrichaceae archaeon]